MSINDVLLQLKDLVESQQTLKQDISLLSSRLQAIESSTGNGTGDHDHTPAAVDSALMDFASKPVSELSVEQLFQVFSTQQTQSAASGAASSAHRTGSLSHAGLSDPEDLQSDYRVIQDSYSKVRLPLDLKFSGSQKGLKPETRDTAAILSTTARYTETCLKVLQDISTRSADSSSAVNNHLDELSTCLVAQLRFLQEEQNALFVQGSFGKKTHALYRQFKRNTSTLGSADIALTS